MHLELLLESMEAEEEQKAKQKKLIMRNTRGFHWSADANRVVESKMKKSWCRACHYCGRSPTADCSSQITEGLCTTPLCIRMNLAKSTTPGSDVEAR